MAISYCLMTLGVMRVTTPLASFKSKSKLCYYRRSVGQSILVSSLIWGSKPDFYYCQTVAGILMWGALSDERTGLSFTISAGPRERSHSRVRIPLFYYIRFETPPTWRARSLYLHPPGAGWPSYTPGTEFPFRRLLRWRYWNQPPPGSSLACPFFLVI
jgi:hypothetical protein